MPERKEICDCSLLEKFSQEPNVPIQWDERLNEYHITYEGGEIMVYFCPFCGGATPPSRRSSLFMHITDEERMRILNSLSGLRYFSEVIEKLGPPDSEFEPGLITTSPGGASTPPETKVYRSIRYGSLSQTADVYFDIGLHERVRPRLLPKEKNSSARA